MKRLTPLVALITLAGTALAPAGAQNNEIPPPVTPQTDTDVAVAGQVVLRVREAAGGFTPEQRAAIVRDRLVPILSIPDLKPEDVRVRQRADTPTATLWVRDHFLITVTEPVARANRTTPAALARVWADNLRRTLPGMSVKPPQTARRQAQTRPVSPNKGEAVKRMSVRAKDFEFVPSRLVVRPGQRVRVTLTNAGQAPHNIEFELPSGEVEFEENVSPGASKSLTFTAPDKPGEYLFYCPVGNHKERGMKGTLVVAGAAQR